MYFAKLTLKASWQILAEWINALYDWWISHRSNAIIPFICEYLVIQGKVYQREMIDQQGSLTDFQLLSERTACGAECQFTL